MLDDIFFSGIGWLYLKIRYRHNKSIQKALEEKYDNSYYAAGFLVLAKPVGAIFLSLIALMIVGAIVSVFKHGLGD